MALPRWLGRFNVAVTNRLTMPIAGWAPWFGIVEHVGRSSGVVRRTPINVFRHGRNRWVVALTYGPDLDWVENVMAAGGCRLRTRGRWIRLVEPRRSNDPSRRQVPLPVRVALWVLRVDWFLELRSE